VRLEEVARLHHAVSGGIAKLEHITARGCVTDRQNEEVVAAPEQDHRLDSGEIAVIERARYIKTAAFDGDGRRVVLRHEAARGAARRSSTNASMRFATLSIAAATGVESPMPKPTASASMRNTTTSDGKSSRKIMRPACSA